MKLLVITQKVDKNDDVLGFFHNWLEKFALKFEKITVICLQEGKYELPSNVKVLSLGKEKIRSRVQYIFNFYKYIWQKRKNYDAVFVHMNSIYVVLGGLFWRLWRKKVVMWYNHPFGNLVSKTAYFLANKVCYVSNLSFFSKSKKAQMMPAGIDTDIFKRDERISKERNSILYLGRISPIKYVDVLIDAVNLMDKGEAKFILNIFGKSAEGDESDFEKIKKLSRELEQAGKIKFHGSVPNYKTPGIYNQNEIFVNLTPSGSFDKAILEAMACEELVLVANKSFENVLPSEFMLSGDSSDLASKLKLAMALTEDKKIAYGSIFRNYVIKNHSLTRLIEEIVKIFA